MRAARRAPVCDLLRRRQRRQDPQPEQRRCCHLPWDGVNEQTKKEAEELFGVKIKVQRRDLQGLGLTAVNTFDAFDGVEVEFDGISPDGSATVNTLPTAEAAKGLVLHTGRAV